MFDPLPRQRQMYEHYLLGLAEAGELDDWDDLAERYCREEIDDDEWPLAHMARLAVDIEAGARRCRTAGSSTGRVPGSWSGPPLRDGGMHAP